MGSTGTVPIRAPHLGTYTYTWSCDAHMYFGKLVAH